MYINYKTNKIFVNFITNLNEMNDKRTLVIYIKILYW